MTIAIDERELVQLYQSGDGGAFDEMVRHYTPALMARATRRLGSRAAAEDAVQETFLRAFRALPRFNGQYKLGAWLHQILANVCTDEGTRRTRLDATAERWAAGALETEDDVVEETTQTLAILDHVSKALTLLPAAYREALELRFVRDLPYEQVATLSGVSEENARARVHRALRAMRLALGVLAGLGAVLVSATRRVERVLGESMARAGAAGVTPATQLAADAVALAPVKPMMVVAAMAGAVTTGVVPITPTRVSGHNGPPRETVVLMEDAQPASGHAQVADGQTGSPLLIAVAALVTRQPVLPLELPAGDVAVVPVIVPPGRGRSSVPGPKVPEPAGDPGATDPPASQEGSLSPEEPRPGEPRPEEEASTPRRPVDVSLETDLGEAPGGSISIEESVEFLVGGGRANGSVEFNARLPVGSSAGGGGNLRIRLHISTEGGSTESLRMTGSLVGTTEKGGVTSYYFRGRLAGAPGGLAGAPGGAAFDAVLTLGPEGVVSMRLHTTI